jgi:hypothetical protein
MANEQTEDREMYQKVINELQADFFYSDRPLEAMKFRDEQ